MNSGNQSRCENEDSTYGLSCVWSGNPPGNLTNGWCYKDVSNVLCSNLTTERACMDTFYCWWQYNDWSNTSKGGNCSNPTWGTGGGGGGPPSSGIFQEWNPGCYIFDMNSTTCNIIIGCNYTNGKCDVITGHANVANIQANGINCTMINDSTVCNNLPMLSTCCAWVNGTCAENRMSTSCKDQMQQPPEGAGFCEDYNAYTSQQLCEQIAGSPWYMPCSWNNATSRCGFKAGDVFGNSTQSLTKIDNKMNCEAASGKWITENYCELINESTITWVSVPAGRCEYKFDEETNCDKACFACESKDSNGNTVNATNAESACIGSALGYCEFTASTHAPNSIGFCKARGQFKNGLATDCNSDCSACTFMGDPTNNDTTKRPSYRCLNSKANSDNGGCKWVTDSTMTTGGYCIKKGEKTCEDACDRCYNNNDCANLGRISLTNSTTGSCIWQTSSGGTGSCVPNTGEDVEICWDGIDNTDDGMADCMDPGCYTDPFCGMVEGNCFGWTNNNTCLNNSCEWMNDTWNPTGWCDFKGANCWKYDRNAGNCSTQSNCQWNNGSAVTGWCEMDMSISEVCMSPNMNRTICESGGIYANCSWTNDTWSPIGGFCEHNSFKMKNCWQYYSSSGCNNITGCSWSSGGQDHCNRNESSACYSAWNNDTCVAAGCWWRTENSPSGGMCQDHSSKCWNMPYSSSQTDCNNALDSQSNHVCWWESFQGGGGQCQSICNNPDSPSGYNQSQCVALSPLCLWAEAGWCGDAGSASCWNNNNATSCNAVDGCRWKDPGWCEPKGGGFAGGMAMGGSAGGSMGAECYKYDGNQSLCTNKTAINISCGWFPELNPRCEVDFSKDCWRYNSVEAGCNATNGCWFNNNTLGGGGSFCTNIMDQCWSNMSLQNNLTACNASIYCRQGQWGNCEPECFGGTSADYCNTSIGCRYITGWCNPAGMNEMFTGMESGAPAPIGMDLCGEGITASVDICGFGMKDMGDSFGLGTNVANFENASACNKEKITMGMPGPGGGMPGSGFTDKIGTGNETIKLYVYLDTDGSTNGGCALPHNSSATGYEFNLRYMSQWNSTLSMALETFNVYKCENSEWKVTDIKISTWKKKMCSEIGGPMIAIKKSDLTKYPTLYDSTKDIRVFVATADASHNISSPSDTAGPGWTTPGSVDFDISGSFDYNTNTAKFEDILKKGFVQGEDCFNGIDDNSDGNIDCNDWGCQYSSNCENKGVNAANHIDTSSPQVTGVKIEEYPDSALIMYDTNKPANGTLEFYYNDSRCSILNTNIYDTGILKRSTVREYKSWHQAMIYNDSNPQNISLDYPLQNDTTYYYKLKVCDSGGKCAVSKCSSFKTSSVSKCGYCNFVTRIKTPTDWNVYYDLDQNGAYEHWQGYVCGPNAGMKTNYTDGRSANIKLNTTDGTAALEFLNVTLTKTGLNDKVRTISTSGSLIENITTDASGNDIGYVGMISETRDKIINNLHPEVCKITIPKGDTNCAELWHCDDNGQNCVNKTANATAIGSTATTCIWLLPYCEFSVWAGGQPANGTTTTTTTLGGSTPSGGGGGGSAGGGATTYPVTDAEFTAGYTKALGKDDKFRFAIENATHYVKVMNVTATTAKINVTSDPQIAVLSIGEEKKFELTGDEYYDLLVTLNSINASSSKANLTIKKLHDYFGETTTTTMLVVTTTLPAPVIPGVPEEVTKLVADYGIYILIIIIIIIAILGWVYYHGHKHLPISRPKPIHE